MVNGGKESVIEVKGRGRNIELRGIVKSKDDEGFEKKGEGKIKFLKGRNDKIGDKKVSGGKIEVRKIEDGGKVRSIGK